jgi:hypothetical protein
MKKYICKNCDWNTNHYSSMQKHLTIKNKCYNPNKKDNALLSLDEKFVYSMINDNFENIQENMNIKNIHMYINELIDKIKYIYKNKIKLCPFCNIYIQNYQKLKRHIIFYCFMNYKNSIIDENNNLSLINENIYEKNVVENLNESININNLLSFIDDNWILEEIDERIQKMICINKFSYSNLLKEILKNNVNQNVYIDTNKMIEQGMVYVNNYEKFIPMPLDNIIEYSMKKLKKLLLEINKKLELEYKHTFEERIYNIDINNIIESKNYIKLKYYKFIECKKIKEEVKLLFTEIYNNNNNIARQIYEGFINNKNILDY